MRRRTFAWRLCAGAALLLAACSRDEPKKDEPPSPPPFSLAGRPNLLLITLDTTRADEIAPWGKGGVAPHVDQLAAESLVALDAHAPAPLTFPSHTSMMTGLYPFAHGVRDNDLYRLDPRAQTLAELLHDAGYRTEAVVAASVVRAGTGLGQGFEHYADVKFRRTRNVAANAERKADEVSALVLERLAVADRRPWFLWAHYFDCHSPYAAPNGPPKSAPRQEQYEAELRFLDSQLARVLDRLRQSGELARTWILVVADHGEGLGIQQELSHAFLAEEGTLRVPFFVRRPDGQLRGQLTAPVSTADVCPTLLAIAGLAPPYAIHGRDVVAMFATQQRGDDAAAALLERPLWFETWAGWHTYHWARLEGVIERGFKYVRNLQDELYDVRDPADPKLEKENLAAARPEIVRALKLLRTQLQDEPVERFDSAAPNLPPDEVARLRELGYLARMTGGDDDAESCGPGALDPRLHYKACCDQEFAVERAQEGEIDLSARVLENLVRAYPKDPVFRETLGRVLFTAGRKQAAAEVFAAALAVDPDLVASNFYLGALKREAGDLAEARRLLTRTVELSPVHLEGWLELRALHDAAKEYELVLQDSIEVVRCAAAMGDADGDEIAKETIARWIPTLLKRLSANPRRQEILAAALARIPADASPPLERARALLQAAE